MHLWKTRPAPPRASSLVGTRERYDLWASAACGAGYLLAAAVAGRRESSSEAEAFEEVNGTRARWLELPQQLGTPWVLVGTSAVAVARGRPRLAVAAGAALPVEKAVEVATKKVVRRRRPAQSPREANLRGDAPVDGPSYPSGHAAIGFAATMLLMPYVPSYVVAATGAGACLTSLRRVQQGAHYPLDSVGGALLGLAVGSGLTWAVGRPM